MPRTYAQLGIPRLRAFRDDCLRVRSIPYLAWLVYAAFASVIVYKMYGDDPFGSIRPSLTLFYAIAGAHVWYRLRRRAAANILAPDIIFVLFYTLFHLGYVTLFAFGVVEHRKDIFYFDAGIPRALFIVNLGIIGFLFGYEVLGSRRRRRQSQTTQATMTPTVAWGASGTILMGLAVAIHVGVLISLGSSYMQAYGYKGLQRLSQYASYSMGLAMTISRALLVLGLLLHTVSSSLRANKLFTSRVALAAVIAAFAINILSGERGALVSIGLPILAVRHYFIKKIALRYLGMMFLAAMVLFSALAVARGTVFAPSKMYDDYQESVQRGDVGWQSGLVEMGTSFVTVDITAAEVPAREPYWHGRSWLGAAIHVVPFLQRSAMAAGWIREAPSKWVTRRYFGQKAAGRAFTVSAEGYLNFGYPGVLIELIALGMFFRWIAIRFGQSPTAPRAFIFLGSIGPMIIVIRNHINVITSDLAILFAAAGLLHLFLQRSPYSKS